MTFPFVYAQDEITDEFEISEPGIEINSSQENIRPQGELIDSPENSPFENEALPESGADQTFDLSTPAESAAGAGNENDGAETESANESAEQNAINDDSVMVRTREEESGESTNYPNELVEVRTPQDVFLPYKQRQNDWGYLFSLGAEQTAFPGLLTQVGIASGDDSTFEEMFGTSGISMLSLEAGPKYNTSVGSFAVLLGYATLNKSDDRIGTESEISFTRYALSAIYYLDTLFDEAYVIPYVGAGMWQAEYRETSESYPDEVGKFSTKPGMQYRFGALLGLDWIEGDAARISRRQNGTQGTFLNFYAISTLMSESDPDPDLESEMDLGASLVIEF